MSNYNILLHKLFSINRNNKVKLGLDLPLSLHRSLGSPAQHFKTIHVAGTNGKGSVCLKISEALRCEGLSVGLFISPHIATFRERIRVNGVMISEEDVERLLTKIFALQSEATFFEITTMMALEYFHERGVDIAVIETGLGGRLDATNIIDPLLSIITSIGFDHMEYLGTTLDEIAYEKAGIIKEETPILIGPSVPRIPIQKRAEVLHAPLYCLDQEFSCAEEENKAIAKKALELLVVSEAAIEKGLEASLPCRFEEVIQDGVPIVLDVAHNPSALSRLFEKVRSRYPGYSIISVIGLSKEKDLKNSLAIIANCSSSIHLVEADNGRGVGVTELDAILMQVDQSQYIKNQHVKVSDGLAAAIREAKNNQGVVIVCGTFFIMAAARKTIGIVEPNDIIDMNEKF